MVVVNGFLGEGVGDAEELHGCCGVIVKIGDMNSCFWFG